MNKFYLCVVFALLISCKKNPVLNLDVIKISEPTDKEGEVIEIDTLLMVPFKSKSLMDFYRSTENQTVWQSESNRLIIIDAIKKCESEGLNPMDYNISKLDSLENIFNDLDEEEQVNYDLQLTYNFEKFLTHLHSGKLNPKELYNNWDVMVDVLDTKSILINALEKDSLICITEKFQPKALTYLKLIKALELISQFPEDKTQPIDTLEVVRHNSSNRAIIDVKKKLIYWKDLDPKDSLTSHYDDKTFAAVKKFQTRHGLLSDGVIGKSTIKALNFTKEERKRQIIVNLERWRWYSKSFAPNYVLINIPNYSLNVVQDQNTTMTKRIVVGKNKRRTPVLTSVLQTIVFNPTWTVPPTILKEDILPELIKDRSYLKNKGIGIYDSKNNEIDPKNWNENRPRGYRYIQKPGYYNALGVVKINFPNKFSVYLHDTNHRDLFERNYRSLSSGCVRIEEPLELVELLLDNPKKFSRGKMDSIIVTKKTLFIGITKRYAIYQWYWTAWSENEELIFRDDIYNLDADLYTQLRN
jgi:murein L,D-transpeptidase YcbB/YkuD